MFFIIYKFKVIAEMASCKIFSAMNPWISC
jgi:hypothetical protein